MSESHPHTVDAAQWRKIAVEMSTAVNDVQCLPVGWQDDSGTQVEITLDGGQAQFSRREAGARDVTTISYNMHSGSVSAEGPAVDEASTYFNMSRHDAATVLVLGDLAARPALVDSPAIMPLPSAPPEGVANSGVTGFEPLTTTELWDYISQIEAMAYEYDPEGYPQDRRNNRAWVSYESNGQTFVDTLNYYETEEGRYLPKVTTQRINPDTLAVLRTDAFLLTDEEQATRIVEPDSLDVQSPMSDKENYEILSSLVENMRNQLEVQHDLR